MADPFVKAVSDYGLDLGNGLYRKILAYDENLMLVEMHFAKGSAGAAHTHPHTQISYVQEGVFEYFIEDDRRILGKGDSVVIESGRMHGCSCLEDGVLLDVFTPMRKDFIQ